MKKQLLLYLILVAFSCNLWASDIQVDGIWYDFNDWNRSASVAYRGGSFDSYDDEYSGDVIIPNFVTYNSVTYDVTSIGWAAFQNCSNLTSVSIPNNTRSIGNGAFAGCI